MRDAVYDVAVVGFGPSGAVAANLLGQAGLTTYVCDKTRDVYEKPRAIALDHEIMRVFQQIGVADKVMPHVEPFTPSEYFGVDGQLIRRMTMVAPPFPLGHTPSMVFSQPPVERILRAQAQSWSCVHIELGVACVSLTQDNEGATLRVQGDNGSEKTIRARYVIACDGAASTVRTHAAITLDDLGFDEPWLVVDVRVNTQGLAKLPLTSVQYCEPGRPCTLVIGPGNHRRWEISLKAGEDPAQAATPEATWKLLARWLTPQDGELWRQASYRFHALVAHEWRKGRVFVAGDAAHQQPPFLGQGMCQGIRDVANLSWKLAAVSCGGLGDTAANALLDSYGEERKAHVRELTTRIKHVGSVICERDTTKARARDRQMLADCAGVVQDTPRQDMIPGLESGFFSQAASSGRGTLFPQPKVAQVAKAPALMDDVFGNGWRLVTTSAPAAADEAPDMLDVMALAGGTLHETEGVVTRWMDKHQCAAALVRPDNYVFGTAINGTELRALVADWQAQMHTTSATSLARA